MTTFASYKLALRNVDELRVLGPPRVVGLRKLAVGGRYRFRILIIDPGIELIRLPSLLVSLPTQRNGNSIFPSPTF